MAWLPWMQRKRNRQGFRSRQKCRPEVLVFSEASSWRKGSFSLTSPCVGGQETIVLLYTLDVCQIRRKGSEKEEGTRMKSINLNPSYTIGQPMTSQKLGSGHRTILGKGRESGMPPDHP